MIDRNARPIFIVLIVLLVLAGIFIYSLIQSKQAIVKDYNDLETNLKTENTKLSDKLEDLNKEKQYLQERLSRIQQDLDGIAKERDEAKGKFDALKKERDDLAARLDKAMKDNQEFQTKAQTTENSEYLQDFLKEKADLQAKVNELENALNEAQGKASEILSGKSSVELELNQLKATNEDLARQLKEAQDFALRLSKQLTSEKGDNSIFSEEISRITSEKDKMSTQLQEANNDKITLGREILQLNDKINKLEQDKNVLNRRLSEVNQTLQGKLAEIMQIKSYLEESKQQADLAGFSKTDVVELPPIVVRSEESRVKSNNLSADVTTVGHVVLINEQQNFIIIDLGENSNIKKNSFFGVYRDGQEIAKVQVIETRDKISAADIKSVKQNEVIKKGDIVKQL